MDQKKKKIGKKKKEKLWLLTLGDMNICLKTTYIYVQQMPPTTQFVTGVGEQIANYLSNLWKKNLIN